MLTNPATMLYHNIDRRVKKEAETAKPKPTMRGLLAKSVDKMRKPQDDITQPLDRVTEYVKMIREQRETEV
jgi:ribosome-binding protein aMBF1 (putative translation factor)